MSTEIAALREQRPWVLARLSTGCTTGWRPSITSGSASCTSCTRSLFLVIGGIEATIMRIQLSSAQSIRFAAGFQSAVYDARNDDDILRGHADFVRLCQLPGAADDWSAGHGVSAIECVQLLADGIWRPASLLQSLSAATGSMAPATRRRGMVRLCAAHFADILRWDTARTTGRWRSVFPGSAASARRSTSSTTILCLRCPGMTLGKMPLFAWLNLVMGGLVLLAISPLTAAQIMLLLDRYLGGHFFDTQAGGSAVLWMHFFWIFGHPEVYVLVIPAFAFVSEIIPVFSRKAIFGYPGDGGGNDGHRLREHERLGAPHVHGGHDFARATPFSCSRPWLSQCLPGSRSSTGSPRCGAERFDFNTPMLFCVGFLFQFLIAGLTGIMLAVAPFDWQLANSYFVVAHFHYVIVGGILFALFGAFYYWFPKMSGRMLSETLGKLHFWLFVIGFHLTFDFMHIPGTAGNAAPHLHLRAGPRLGHLELDRDDRRRLSGSWVLVFVCNLIWSYLQGEMAGNDPWDAWTLEWSTTSPPPEYNFASIPTVREPPSAVGPQASRRSGLEIRVMAPVR